jgi:hypothetical protein
MPAILTLDAIGPRGEELAMKAGGYPDRESHLPVAE